MASRKFKFVSPGVFLKEIDNSQLPRLPGPVGPVIIGRTRKGPAMRPVRVDSFRDFVTVFGETVPGNQATDPWRYPGLQATAYAPYAAQAYLSSQTPVTMIRLAGVVGDDADATDGSHPGWDAEYAFGIFGFQSSSAPTFAASGSVTGSLLGVIYANTGSLQIGVKGTSPFATGDFAGSGSAKQEEINSVVDTGDAGKVVATDSDKFTIYMKNATTIMEKEVSFLRGGNYIRDVLNTNPVKTKTRISSVVSGTLAEKYWLGETFEEEFARIKRISGNKAINMTIIPLGATDQQMGDFKSANHAASPARTGWVFPQNFNSTGSFAPRTASEKLFRIIARNDGEESSRDLIIRIAEIRIKEEGSLDPYGSFSVVVEKITPTEVITVERFDKCNLNPNSSNFLAKKIGDQYIKWDSVEKRNKVYGSNPTQSRYIRVEMHPDIAEDGPSNPASVPFGFFGPLRPIDNVQIRAGSRAGDSAGRILHLTGTAQVGHGFDITVPVELGGSRASDGVSPQKIEVRFVSDAVFSGSLEPNTVKIAAATLEGGATEAMTYAIAAINGTSSFAKADYVQHGPFATGTLDPAAHGIPGITAELADDDGADGAGVVIRSKRPFAPGSKGDAIIISASVGGVRIPATQLMVSSSNLTGHNLGFVSGTNTRSDGSSAFFSGALGQLADHDIAAVRVEYPPSPTVEILLNSVDYVMGATPFKKDAYKTTSGLENSTINEGWIDYHRRMPMWQTAHDNQITGLSDDFADFSYIFSLDDVVVEALTAVSADMSSAQIVALTSSEGSHLNGTSYTGLGHPARVLVRDVVDSFRLPLDGGFDGLDITEADPFNMDVVTSDSTTANSYAYASIDRAIETIRDPEAVEMNLAAMPGITNESLTTKLVETCESRADALAIIDLPDVYIPPFQRACSSFEQRLPNAGKPTQAASTLTKRQLNSSYGATYYPWLKVKDTIYNRDVWVPPSVIALGVMAYSEKREDAVWFAPAGFNRGGLNEGNAGLPVLQASTQLLSKQRDTLYEANINPIASFVTEGLVVFGQKTLQTTQSALDRINVRRLLIFVKREVSRISNGLLFDQNVQATWNRFKSQVEPFLQGVQTRLGLSDFRVILDETTTTPDLVDRNIMYAKIFLKPARAIEFIAVDFVITNTGASFDD